MGNIAKARWKSRGGYRVVVLSHERADETDDVLPPLVDAVVPLTKDIGIEIDQTLQGGLVIVGVRQQAGMKRPVDILREQDLQARGGCEIGDRSWRVAGNVNGSDDTVAQADLFFFAGKLPVDNARLQFGPVPRRAVTSLSPSSRKRASSSCMTTVERRRSRSHRAPPVWSK